MSSYNKNPSAANDPDGIVAVWNLHLLERPEFIFHSPVGAVIVYSYFLVRRSFGHLLALPSDTDFWRLVLGPGSLVGHSSQASTCFEDPTVRSGPHVPDIRHEDGRHAECEQSSLQQYRWISMQLVSGHVGSASGKPEEIISAHIRKPCL